MKMKNWFQKSRIWQKRDAAGGGESGSFTIGPTDRVVVAPERVERIVIEPSPAILVKPPLRPFWDDRGWTCQQQEQKTQYDGVYRVVDPMNEQVQVFSGRIIKRNQRLSTFIKSPPEQYRQHPKAPCFHHHEGEWYQLKWRQPPDHPDAAILYIESLLSDILGRT